LPIKLLQNCPPHLKNVAALPCETQETVLTIYNVERHGVGRDLLSKHGLTKLIFVEQWRG